VASLVLAVCVGSAAHATVVLDQSTFTNDPTLASGVLTGMFVENYPTDQSQLETITAGVSGKLTELDLKIQQYAGAGAVELLIFEGGFVDGQSADDYQDPVFTGIIQQSTLPVASSSETNSVTRFDVSAADIELTQGEVFSFSVRSAEPYGVSNVVELTSTLEAYGGGKTYISGNIGIPYRDYTGYGGSQAVQFQTWVDNGLAAPEPATWTTMLVGLALVGARARRRFRVPDARRFLALSRLTLAITTALVGVGLASSAGAADFLFSFSNNEGKTPGTVSGEIFGLQDNATSAATDIIVTAYPAGDYGFPAAPFSPIALAAARNGYIAANSFTVQNDEIVAAVFQMIAYSYFDINVDGKYNELYFVPSNNTRNLEGLAGVTFTPVSSPTPEAPAWIALLVGMGLLGAKLRRRAPHPA
jgi:hypothetical protein